MLYIRGSTLSEDNDSCQDCNGNQVGGKTRVEDERLHVKIVNQQQTKNAQRQGHDCKIPQNIGLHFDGNPQQGGRFNQPSNGDPVAVQLQGNGNGDECDGNRHMDQVDDSTFRLGEALFEYVAHGQVGRRQRQGIPGESLGFAVIHREQHKEHNRGVYQGQKRQRD